MVLSLRSICLQLHVWLKKYVGGAQGYNNSNVFTINQIVMEA